MRSGDVVGGRFRIESLAGSGGMGSVWKALDQQTRKLVALKLLHGRDPRDAVRFVREAQLIAGLAHPGIVGYVTDGQISEAERYLVMEWLEGESLAERIGREPLTLAETLTMGRNAALALGAMHGHGVVHRDLKPSNLFLEGGRPERVKIIDFGIARRDVGPDVTRAGVLLGTPGYIAPEQALGELNVDARSDLFALGCVLFKCITGQGAFGADDDLTVLLRIARGTAIRAKEIVRQLPSEVDDMLAWLLKREPAERPRDAIVAADALGRLATIYGAGRPGDDPLDDLVTTQARSAIVFEEEDPILSSTSPFPLTVPRSTRTPIDQESTSDGTVLTADDLEDVSPDSMPTAVPRGKVAQNDVSKAFAGDVARALAAVTPSPPASPPAPVPSPVPSAHSPAPSRRSQTNPWGGAPPPSRAPSSHAVPAPPLSPVHPTSSRGASQAPTPPPSRTPTASPQVAAPAAHPPRSNTANPPRASSTSIEAVDPAIVQILERTEALLKQNDFRNALLQARRGIEAGARGELYGALRARQAEAYKWRGERSEAERAAVDAMSSLPSGKGLWWLAAREAVIAAGARSDAARVGALAEEIMRILPSARADAESVGTLTSTATFLMHTGHNELLDRFLRWVEPLLGNIAPDPPAYAARLQQLRALRATYQSDLWTYLEAAEAAAERFAAAQDMRNSLIQRVNVAFAKLELGARAHAEADLRVALQGAERMGLNNVALAARANLGIALARRGKTTEARTIMLEVLKESVSSGDRRFEAAARIQLSIILLATGDTEGAVREATGAVELSPTNAPSRVFALGALSRAHLSADRPAASLQAASRAMTLLASMGGIEEGESLARLALAEAKRAVGDVDGAALAITEARERLKMRARRIVDPAFRESFLRDVPENARILELSREWLSESREWTA